MEKYIDKPTAPTPQLQRGLGTTALIFIEPFAQTSYLDNPRTYLGKIDEDETFDEIEVGPEEVNPSYATSSEDFRLLRRSQRSMSNRTKRQRKRR